MKHIWKFVVIIAFAVPMILHAQQKEFQPVPEVLKPQYHLNFKNFFSSPEAEVVERKAIEDEWEQLRAVKQEVAASGKHLFLELELLDKIRFQYRKHDLYLFFRFATNMNDQASQNDAAALRAIAVAARGMVEQAILKLPDEELKHFFSDAPQLEKYRYAIEAIQRQKPFRLPEEQERIVAEIEPLASGDFYRQIVSSIQFGSVETPDGKTLDVFRQHGEVENHPDPAVRKEGTLRLFESYDTKRDALALGLIQLIQLQNKLSQLHNFRNVREESYFEDYLSDSEVERIYHQIAEQSGLYNRFEKLQEERRNAVGTSPPRFSIPEATQIIRNALAPLGKEYATELSNLLDPKNGRMDIVPGENRLPMQGGASVYPVGISTFFAFNYEGYYIDLILIAHESGHAVQAMLMSNNKVPMAYAAGPAYFTESFGRLNELIVAHYLWQQETDPVRREFFKRQFSDRAFALFPSAIEAAVESAIHQGVETGKIQNADDMDRIAEETGSQYFDAFKLEKEREKLWMDAPEYFVAPLHKVHNVYASVLALKFYQMYTENPKVFIPRYLALLKNGYNAPPDILLKKFLGIDFRDSGLTSDALSFLKDRLNETENKR